MFPLTILLSKIVYGFMAKNGFAKSIESVSFSMLIKDVCHLLPSNLRANEKMDSAQIWCQWFVVKALWNLVLCKYAARDTCANSQKEQCCRDCPYRIQHTVTHLFHRQERNGQHMIDGKKPDQSEQWIYFCDRQQNREKKNCRRRNQSYNLIFTDCR